MTTNDRSSAHHPDFWGGTTCRIRCACGWKTETMRANTAWANYRKHENEETNDT